MNKQLDVALLESQKMRIEVDQVNRNYNYMKRENEKLQQEIEDFLKQVRGKKGGQYYILIVFLYSNGLIYILNCELSLQVKRERCFFF